MTTPGGQLTPGDENTPPVYGTPDGAYVGDASSPNAVQQLSHMTEASAKEAMRTPIGPSFAAQRDGFWGALNALLGLVQGGIDLVVGVVVGVVDGIKTIIGAIGSLFGMSRADMAAIDKARADGEKIISQNMSSSLEYLDEIQRVGGAFGGWPSWRITNGELDPHPLPLGSDEPDFRGAFPLSQGTLWHPPTRQWGTRTDDWLFGGNNSSRGTLAALSGTLELLEPGLWMIYFQAAVLQGGSYTNTPADVWCYVSSQKDWVPVGSPVSGMASYNRVTEAKSTSDANGYGAIHTFGRAGQYLGSRDSSQGGGNTVSGYMMCYLDSPGWFIHMSCTAYKHFGGEASTFVFAQKVNSNTLRGDIDQAQADIAAALPGLEVPKDLDEASIAAMVAQAQDLEAPPVEVPPFEEAPGD